MFDHDISLAKCFEFYMWCDGLPTTGASRLASDLLARRFKEICHPSQRTRWQVDKEAIGLSGVH